MGAGPATWSRVKRLRIFIAVGSVAILGAGAGIGATAASASPTLATRLAAEFPGYHIPATASKALYDHSRTATPIKHVVVIFDENESFDHYFGTYPYAANTGGTPFVAKPGTPTVHGLYSEISSTGPIGPLLTDNPNEYNPQRLTPAEALTSDQNHGDVPEQLADDNNKQDAFVQNTESSSPSGCAPEYCPPGISLDYFDGNTVTGLWNYAQNYAMSDNDFDTAFGPSSPGAINVVSGNTAGGYAVDANSSSTPGVKTTAPGEVSALGSDGTGTIYGDIDPFFDQCSDNNHTPPTSGQPSPEGVLTGPNIGNLLNAKHVTWGWFQGGFAPTSTNSGGAVCGAEHELTSNGANVSEELDYVPHHDPFQFYASTANPAHLPPSSLNDIGYTDQANHQYDVSLFADALNGTGGATLPAVSYIKPPKYENGHPGNSDPLLEQQFVVNTVNSIEESRYWSSTAIIITYDDSDGWYDHVIPPVINGSDDPAAGTTPAVGDTKVCSSVPITVGTAEDRCGFGDRLPFLVISPYTRQNYVSSQLLNTASVVKFIEDNWLHGQRIPGSFDAVSGSIDGHGGLLDFNVRPHFSPVILDPTSGAVVSGDAWYGNKGELKPKKSKK
jgi:phospholipase C